jgi:hypothetical protein
MGYCQAFLHAAKKATPTNDLGAPCVVEREYAEDNNEIVCTLKVVDSKGTLLVVVCPPGSHCNAPQVMTHQAA